MRRFALRRPLNGTDRNKPCYSYKQPHHLWYWDLKQYRPCIVTKKKEYICEDSDGDIVKATADFEEAIVARCEDDYEEFEQLNGECIDALIPISVYEELQYYGNSFRVLIPVNDRIYAIDGRFLDNTVVYWYPTEEIEEADWKEFWKVWRDIQPEIRKVLATYEWRPTDAWRGHYEGHEDESIFAKVVEGWVAIGAANETIVKLAKLEKLEAEEYPDYPVLFVFPRSSNVCVTYFDVYVPRDKVEDFKRFLGIKSGEEFNVTTGYWVLTH